MTYWTKEAKRAAGVGILCLGLALAVCGLKLKARSVLAQYRSSAPVVNEEPRFYMWWEETRTSFPYQPQKGGEPGLLTGSYQTFRGKRLSDLEGKDADDYLHLHDAAGVTSAQIQKDRGTRDEWRTALRRLADTPWETHKQVMWVLLGYLPDHVRASVPDNGRIEDGEERHASESDDPRITYDCNSRIGIYYDAERYTAAWRLLVDWEGKPLRLVTSVRGIEGADARMCSSWALAKRIKSGELPRPKKLDDAEHAEVRLKNPGKREFGDVYWRPLEIEHIAAKQGVSVSDVVFDLNFYGAFESWGTLLAVILALVGGASILLGRSLAEY